MLVVPAGAAPERLDRFLVKHADISRAKLQQLIKSGGITLNDKTTKPHHLVHPGDQIIVHQPDMPIHQQAKVADPVAPSVIAEDDDYLVVNKPAGLVVHGGPGIHEPTLADWAVKHSPLIAAVGDQPNVRPGIVHRLDRDVSGVMVLAKSQPAFDSLKAQFQDHTVNKNYLALVHGRITDQTGRITFAIARKPDHSGLMTARPGSNEGQAAETRFAVERFVKNMTLVKIKTMTGRMHQIRVHFKAIEHPLVGDPLYKIKRVNADKYRPPRVFLHAERLAYDDLSGQRREYQAPLPADLAQFLARVS